VDTVFLSEFSHPLDENSAEHRNLHELIDWRQSQEQEKSWDCPVISFMQEVPGVRSKEEFSL
jgi:hypothetical protein